MTELKKLGKYEVRRELGKGAMGVVVEGFDPMIARRVALKTVRRDQLDRSEVEEILARFQREAQAAGRLNHPNIVAIYEYGEDDGVAFIAMEFIEGAELKDALDANERFPMSEIVRIMTQLLEALDYSHKNGVVHRDIKPSNIIMLKDGTVKVADFGIARVESSTLTQAGSVLGTPSYMSPEQFMGQTVDGRSDLFSAGVILYQFLTGEKPFTGALTTIMHKVLQEEPLAPSALNVQVPRPFDAVMRKALAKRPNERFQTGHEFAVALKKAAENQAVPDADATLVNGIADSEATLVTAVGNNAISDVTAKIITAPSLANSPLGSLQSSPRNNASGNSTDNKKRASNNSGGENSQTKRQSQGLALAIVGGIAVIGLGAAAYVFMGKGYLTDPDAASGAQNASQTTSPTLSADTASVSTTDNGIITISALGLVDPSDPRYQQDQGLINADLQADAKRQLIEKAVALYVEPNSLTKNYALVREKLLTKSGDFIQTVIEEGRPQLGKDGLMSLTTRATVRVRDVQKSLNQMSAEERVEFIRNNGDPKISVAIATKSAEADPAAPPQRSAIAENLLKERIQSFGFRMWNDDVAVASKEVKEGKQGADFAVTGEAKFKKLSAKLAASGITIEKFVLTSWTVKATDKRSGEEIYYNTKIPEKTSWATEDEALRDVGKLIGEEFSKGFFLSHFQFSGQQVRLKLQGLSSKETAQQVLHELNGLRGVLTATSVSSSATEAVFDTLLSGGMGNANELVQASILTPLNHKLGKQCFNFGPASGKEIVLTLEASCKDPAILSRLDNLPPAALMAAPQTRREAVARTPDMLKKINM